MYGLLSTIQGGSGAPRGGVPPARTPLGGPASSLPYKGLFFGGPGLPGGPRSLSRGFCILWGRGPGATTWPETSSGDPPYGKWGSGRAGGCFSGVRGPRGAFSAQFGPGEMELIFRPFFEHFFVRSRKFFVSCVLYVCCLLNVR